MDGDKPTVLVIEDEEMLLQAIVRKLELNQMKPIPCKSGKEAIDVLNRSDKLPNAIWLDYYLKDMNGLEFMYSIKKDERFADILTIVVSNSAGPDKVKSMLTFGAKKYYLKAENKLDDIIVALKGLIKEEDELKKKMN